MVGIFPYDAALARFVTVVVEFHDECAVAQRHYLSEESMAKIDLTQAPPIRAKARKALCAIG